MSDAWELLVSLHLHLLDFAVGIHDLVADLNH